MKGPSAGDVDPGRRGFLRGKFLTGEGRKDMRRQGQALGPLPPALLALLGRPPVALPCLDCERPCIAACEPDIIRFHPREHTRAGLAYLSFVSGGCTFCGACIEVCPAAPEARRERSAASIGEAVLARDVCIAWNGVSCMSCRFACAPQAIAMDPHNRPSVEAARCTGCGFCVSVCPVGALAVVGPFA